MNRIICDKCGKRINPKLLSYACKVEMSRGMFRFKYDLCDNCLLKVREFIENAQIEQTDCPWK